MSAAVFLWLNIQVQGIVERVVSLYMSSTYLQLAIMQYKQTHLVAKLDYLSLSYLLDLVLREPASVRQLRI